jgi:hypothetical protein
VVERVWSPRGSLSGSWGKLTDAGGSSSRTTRWTFGMKVRRLMTVYAYSNSRRSADQASSRTRPDTHKLDAASLDSAASASIRPR